MENIIFEKEILGRKYKATITEICDQVVINDEMIKRLCEGKIISFIVLKNSDIKELIIECDIYRVSIDNSNHIKNLIINGNCEIWPIGNHCIERIKVLKSDVYDDIEGVLYTKPKTKKNLRYIMCYPYGKENSVFEMNDFVCGYVHGGIRCSHLKHLILSKNTKEGDVGTFIDSCENIQTIYIHKEFNTKESSDAMGFSRFEFKNCANPPKQIDVYYEGSKKNLTDNEYAWKGLSQTSDDLFAPYVNIVWHFNVPIDEYKKIIGINADEKC